MPATQPTGWDYKDTLRIMTEKFNTAVQAIQELQVNSENVNSATIQSINDIQNSFNEELEVIKEDLRNKIDNVTAEDLNLGNVDNTSDMDKPVSTATREAIDLAVKDMATTEEAEDEFKVENLYDPEVSTPIKTYIENRLVELFNAYQEGTYEPRYNISTEERLGVVKSGGDVIVNSVSGKMEVPELTTINNKLGQMTSSITSVTVSLESNNEATSELSRNQGNLNSLETNSKTSVVTAINELVERINELATATETNDGNNG